MYKRKLPYFLKKYKKYYWIIFYLYLISRKIKLSKNVTMMQFVKIYLVKAVYNNFVNKLRIVIIHNYIIE